MSYRNCSLAIHPAISAEIAVKEVLFVSHRHLFVVLDTLKKCCNIIAVQRFAIERGVKLAVLDATRARDKRT